MAGAAGVGEEVRANGLDGTLGSLILGDLADGLEVLLGGPALREGGERKGNHSSHFAVDDEDGDGGLGDSDKRRNWKLV